MLRCRKLSTFVRHRKHNSSLSRLWQKTALLGVACRGKRKTRTMKLSLGISRRSIVIAVAAVATVISLGIGANAALNKISNDARQAIRNIGSYSEQSDGRKDTVARSRIALVIGNGRYPDAREPLTQPINDARALTRRAAPGRLRRRRRRGCQQGRHAPRRRPAEGEGHARHRRHAVLRRLRHPGRPRELHDPGRCRDLEGRRCPPPRHQRRIAFSAN